MQFARFIDLTADEKSESLQRGSFTRDGVRYDYWRTSCHGEAWFRADEPTGMTEFPVIHATAEVDADETIAADEWSDENLDPDFREVLRKMEAASSDDERDEIWDQWLLRGES